MSVQAMTWVIENSAQKGSNLLCLLMIANYADKKNAVCWPSIDLLASDCRLSRRQVIRIVQDLAESGEVVVEWGSGPYGTHRFTMTFQASMGCKDVTGDKVSPPCKDVTRGGDKTCTKGVTKRAKGGDTHVTQTVKEPVTEPVSTVGDDASPDALIPASDLVPGRIEIKLTAQTEKAWIKEEFATDIDFLRSWGDWCRLMGKKRKSVKAEQAQRYFDMFENYPVEAVIGAIEISVQRGYTVIYEDRIRRNAPAPASHPSKSREDEVLEYLGMGT